MNHEKADTVDSDATSGCAVLEERLQRKLSGRVRDLHVIPQGSGIVLRGLARTYRAKELAQQTLMMETQQSIVANEIEVR